MDAIRLLEELAEEIRRCTKCPLSKHRTNAVPGEGNPRARVFLVGEAPGRNEDLEGRPFVGAAGRLLDKLLGLAGLERSSVFITNVVKCRPPGNRDPRPEEIAACSPYLDRQLAVIEPEIVVALGRHSASYLLGKAGVRARSIMKVRGRIYRVRICGLEVEVFPTLHPAAALYNPKMLSILERDFYHLREILGGGVPSLDRFLRGGELV